MDMSGVWGSLGEQGMSKGDRNRSVSRKYWDATYWRSARSTAHRGEGVASLDVEREQRDRSDQRAKDGVYNRESPSKI